MSNGPAIAFANHYRFSPGQILEHGPVDSRMQLWCRSGSGTVTVNGQQLALEAGMLVLLPWGRMMRYEADRRHPFILAGVHLWPQCLGGEEGMPERCAHGPHDPLRDAGRFADDPDLRPRGIWQQRCDDRDPVLLYGEYLVCRWGRAVRPQPAQRRLQARNLIAEWRSLAETPRAVPLPMGLQRLLDHCDRHLADPPDLRECARILGCSRATVTRLFRDQFDCSAIAWMRQRRLERAAELLTTTSMRIGAIAKAVGFADPLHFSRCFHAVHGCAPRTHRARHGRF